MIHAASKDQIRLYEEHKVSVGFADLIRVQMKERGRRNGSGPGHSTFKKNVLVLRSA